MTGMSPIAKATLRSLTLQAVVADTRELRTAPHDAALPFLFIQEQTRTAGFKPFVGHAFFSPMSWLFSFSFMLQGTPVTDPGMKFAGHREDVQELYCFELLVLQNLIEAQVCHFKKIVYNV